MIGEIVSAIREVVTPGPTLYHYRCTQCFGIVGTEESNKDDLTCICGGKLRDLVAGEWKPTEN